MMTDDLVALGHTGSDHFAGLEVFPNPGAKKVSMNSNEFTAVCPITGQPDLYEVTITYEDSDFCVESKSLKLYLAQFRNQGAFVEALAVQIKGDIVNVLNQEGGSHVSEDDVEVVIVQRRRGGVEIEVTA